MHLYRSISLLFLLGVTSMSGNANEPEPVRITNSGPIQIDQASQSVTISEQVEIHLQPFYLKADQLRWTRNTDRLQVLGNVRLLADPGELEPDQSLPSFLGSAGSLPSDEPIEFLRTETLLMDTTNRSILAEQTAQIQAGQARIVGEEFHIDIDSNRFSAQSYRAGFNNLFLEGESLQVEGPDLVAPNAHFFWGEPDSFSFQGNARSVEKQGDDAVILRGVTLQLGAVPFFYWPYYRHSLERSRFSMTGTAGYSGDLGTYAEIRPIFLATEHSRWFADVQGFSKRGWLVGPGFDIEQQWSTGHYLKTHLQSGFIHDQGELGTDTLGQAIDRSRDFVDLSLIHRYASSFQLISRVESWSDSEVVRDFAPGQFRAVQQPESFVEAHGIWGPLIASVTTRFRHESFETVIERRPELALTLLPSPLADHRLYHSGQVATVHLREQSPDGGIEREHTRARAYYQLWYPVALRHWLDFIPQATAQHLSYRDIAGLHENLERTQFELGFNLTAHAFADWSIHREVWNLQSLRHLLQPTLQYRYLKSEGNDTDLPLPIEQRLYGTGIPDLDLSASTSLDTMRSGSLIRFGVLNALVARRLDGKQDKWIDLNLFHDTFLPDASQLDTEHTFALHARLRPAHWLHMDIQARADTDDLAMRDLFARIQLIDGDIWDLDLATQFVSSQLQQYLLGFRYKLREDLRVLMNLGYDERGSRFYEQSYGLQYAISNSWDLQLSVNLRQGSSRNNRTRFEVRIRTARF